jgi:hypothetical protein
MSSKISAQGFLLELAAEEVAPLIGECAGALAAGPLGAAGGAVVGRVAQKAINYFGPPVVKRWLEWLRTRSQHEQLAAITSLASLSGDQARQMVTSAVERMASRASSIDRKLAIDYLTAIPQTARRSLVLDRSTGGFTLPSTLSPTTPETLLQMLPLNVSPYLPGSQLPNTPYRLDELIGTGGFGSVYRATAPSLQHLQFAIKFCLDESFVATLQNEKNTLEHMIESCKGNWTDRIVRLYGYDLDHLTPFLVYKYVQGNDLASYLSEHRQRIGRGLSAEEAFSIAVRSLRHWHSLINVAWCIAT